MSAENTVYKSIHLTKKFFISLLALTVCKIMTFHGNVSFVVKHTLKTKCI